MATIKGTNLADTINGTSLADLILGEAGNDLLRGLDGNDEIHGGAGNDILEGGAGNDRLFADAGNDSLFGGEGSDILVSGTGSDHMNGGSGIDAASWQDSSVAISADLSTGRASDSFVEDTMTRIENLIGSRFDDTLRGDSGANELFGGAGNDVLLGGGGSDRLIGGSGNDTFDGGAGTNKIQGDAGIDTVTFGGATFVDVDLVRGSALSSLGQSSLSGIENVYTTSGNDVVLGNAGANKIMGLAGNDRMDGGTGADTFVFQAIDLQRFGTPGYDAGGDAISDFGAGDRIDLSRHFEQRPSSPSRPVRVNWAPIPRCGSARIRSASDMSLKSLSAEMFLF